MKDLEKAGQKLNNHFERRAEQKGEELSNSIISSTSQGRGLWFFLHLPAWIMIVIFGTMFFKNILEVFAIGSPWTLAGFVPACVMAQAWYKWEYTKKHPFFSFILGGFCAPMGLILISSL